LADDYEVGFGKPPKANQFRQGSSGNPAGRPKGSKTVATIFHEVTRELIHVTQNGRDRTVTKLEAIMLQLTSKALSGDLKAMKEILQWNSVFEESASKEAVDYPDREKDAKAMQRIVNRILQRNQGQPTENADQPTENE
jgi:hypothetical protein